MLILVLLSFLPIDSMGTQWICKKTSKKRWLLYILWQNKRMCWQRSYQDKNLLLLNNSSLQKLIFMNKSPHFCQRRSCSQTLPYKLKCFLKLQWRHLILDFLYIHFRRTIKPTATAILKDWSRVLFERIYKQASTKNDNLDLIGKTMCSDQKWFKIIYEETFCSRVVVNCFCKIFATFF